MYRCRNVCNSVTMCVFIREVWVEKGRSLMNGWRSTVKYSFSSAASSRQQFKVLGFSVILYFIWNCNILQQSVTFYLRNIYSFLMLVRFCSIINHKVTHYCEVEGYTVFNNFARKNLKKVLLKLSHSTFQSII